MIHKVDDCVRRSRNLRSRLIVAIIYDIITRKYIIIILVHRHHMSLCSRVLGSKRQLVAISRYIQVHKMVVFITGSRGIRTIIRNPVFSMGVCNCNGRFKRFASLLFSWPDRFQPQSAPKSIIPSLRQKPCPRLL